MHEPTSPIPFAEPLNFDSYQSQDEEVFTKQVFRGQILSGSVAGIAQLEAEAARSAASPAPHSWREQRSHQVAVLGCLTVSSKRQEAILKNTEDLAYAYFLASKNISI